MGHLERYLPVQTMKDSGHLTLKLKKAESSSTPRTYLEKKHLVRRCFHEQVCAAFFFLRQLSYFTRKVSLSNVAHAVLKWTEKGVRGGDGVRVPQGHVMLACVRSQLLQFTPTVIPHQDTYMPLNEDHRLAFKVVVHHQRSMLLQRCDELF